MISLRKSKMSKTGVFDENSIDQAKQHFTPNFINHQLEDPPKNFGNNVSLFWEYLCEDQLLKTPDFEF